MNTLSSLTKLEQVGLLKHIYKVGEKFEKVGKVLNGVARENLALEWDIMKRRMRNEVVETRKTKPNFSATKWIKAEIRRLISGKPKS